MTDMKRVTISVPENMDKRIVELRKKDEFMRCSYSEIVRQLLMAGLAAKSDKKESA